MFLSDQLETERTSEFSVVCASPLWSLHAPSPLDDRIVVALPSLYDLRNSDSAWTPATGSHRGHRRSVDGHQQAPLWWRIQALYASSSAPRARWRVNAAVPAVARWAPMRRMAGSAPAALTWTPEWASASPRRPTAFPGLSSGLSQGRHAGHHPNELAKKLTHCPLGHPVGAGYPSSSTAGLHGV